MYCLLTLARLNREIVELTSVVSRPPHPPKPVQWYLAIIFGRTCQLVMSVCPVLALSRRVCRALLCSFGCVLFVCLCNILYALVILLDRRCILYIVYRSTPLNRGDAHACVLDVDSAAKGLPATKGPAVV